MEWRERIGGMDWTVVEVSPQDSPDSYGECDYSAMTIRIQDGLEAQVRSVTLWHERLHAMLYSAGIRKHDERLVDALAHAIVAFLRDEGRGTTDAEA